MDIAAGTVVANKFEILGPLGRGGMGELFKARNTRTERRVALKLLRADAKHRTDAIERFRREARAAGMINSDHVTQVLDVEDDPQHGIAIAFELLEGESLLERLRRTGPMDLETIHPIVEQILRGLGDAHAVGIIHRDLKPSNVFLERRPDGTVRVKILDFGISKLPKQIAKTTLTEPGQSLGSFMFMPPEQIQRAASVDARADVYALGTLVFQAMTGHLPFSARNMVELVQQKTNGTARTLAEATGKAFPPQLEAWVARCLRLSRDERFQSAVDAAQAWAMLKPQPRSGDVPSSQPVIPSSGQPMSPRHDRASQPAWGAAPPISSLPAGYVPLPPGRTSQAPASPPAMQQAPYAVENPATAPLPLNRVVPQQAPMGQPNIGSYPAPPVPAQMPAAQAALYSTQRSGDRAPAPAAAQPQPQPAKRIPTWLVVVTIGMVLAALGVLGVVAYTLWA